MLSSTLWRALTQPITYALLVVLVGTAVMQVKYVNKALQRFDSTQVIPIQFVMFTLSVIIGSAILYRDFEKATADSVGKFIGGCFLTFSGVWLITSGRQPHDDDTDEESDLEGDRQEERFNLAQQEPESQSLQKDPTNNSMQHRPSMQGADGANDAPESRRSSRVSFSEASSFPKLTQMYSNASYQPGGRPVPSISTPTVDENEVTPLLGGVLSNIHQQRPQSARHPGLPSAISTPHLPTEAQITAANSLKPPVTPRTTSQGNVHTHPSQQLSPAPPQADRPMTPARHSISRMLPGPLLSPLSGGLSVVVADSLMRGIDMPARARSYRRPRPSTKRTNSSAQRSSRHDLDGEDDEAGTSPPKTSPNDTSNNNGNQGQNDWARITRARSLSTTLSDLFRGKSKQDVRPGPEDEESGPSGP